MSNNAPDYENDLVFPPQEIKSHHELSEQGRQSEVLISTIEKCEKLEKQLKIAIEALSRYADSSDWSDCESNGAVQFVLNEGGFDDYGYKIAQEALEQIKELDK